MCKPDKRYLQKSRPGYSSGFARLRSFSHRTVLVTSFPSKKILRCSAGISYTIARIPGELDTNRRVSMSTSAALRNRRLLLNPGLLVVAHFVALASAFAQAPNGSYIAAFRTPKHVAISKPEVFHDAVEEVVRHLENNKVDLVSDPLRGRIETQDAISIDSLIKITKDAGASYLLYIIVDRPVAQWLKVTLQCYDLDQKMLWQASAGYTGAFDVNSKKALPEIMKKLDKELAPKFDHPGLMLKKTSPAPSPLTEGRPQQ